MHFVRSLSGLVLLLAVASLGGAAQGTSGYTSDQSVIQVVSTNVQGKNVYIPSTIVVAGGKEHTLSFFNTTEVPHGFRIEGLGLETILPPKVEVSLTLPPLEGGRIFQIHCQLHPAHRTGTLVVLPGAPETPRSPALPSLIE